MSLERVLELLNTYNDCLLVNNVTIKLRRHANLSLTVLTDMHAGGVIAESHIEGVINEASHLNTDAVVIVGDLVDGSVDEIGERIRSLTKLRRPVAYSIGGCMFPIDSHPPTPVFYVSGNHEFYYGRYNEWMHELERYNVAVLHNKAINLKGVCLIGFDEHINEMPGRIYETLSTSCKGVDETAARIVLVHNPRIAAVITRNETLSRYADIVISGHVHAGQFYLVAPLPWMFFPYYYGHYPPKYDYQPHVYVSAGVHFWAVPMKMLGYAEITRLTLIG